MLDAAITKPTARMKLRICVVFMLFSHLKLQIEQKSSPGCHRGDEIQVKWQ